MNISLIISSLDCGGAERVLVEHAKYYFGRGWRITVITLNKDVPDFYSLPDGIHRVTLDASRISASKLSAIINNVNRIKLIRKSIMAISPDVVISFMTQTNINILLALVGTKIPVIVTEHIDPVMLPAGFIWEKFRRATYPMSSCLVSVSSGVDSYFRWLPKSKRKVIFNPLVETKVDTNTSLEQFFEKDKNYIVAMGRFVRQKGFDLLIKGFARLKDRYPNWTLTILGDGDLRPQLESLRDELGLENRVHLPGIVKNPHQILKRADIFVLSSRYEGFGMALTEAMACGLPVISADCPSGPREIIRDGVDGVLVPPEDIDALAVAMDRLMSDEAERNRLASRAMEVSERFGLEKVMGMWEEVLNRVTREKRL